jgi:hypothetical protein
MCSTLRITSTVKMCYISFDLETISHSINKNRKTFKVPATCIWDMPVGNIQTFPFPHPFIKHIQPSKILIHNIKCLLQRWIYFLNKCKEIEVVHSVYMLSKYWLSRFTKYSFFICRKTLTHDKKYKPTQCFNKSLFLFSETSN